MHYDAASREQKTTLMTDLSDYNNYIYVQFMCENLTKLSLLETRANGKFN